jgi:hypothetical protein
MSKALAFVTRITKGKVGRDGRKDIDHIRSVAHRVAGDGGNYLHITVSYLHEVYEDSLESAPQLVALRLPSEVMMALDALYHRKHEPYADYAMRVARNVLARFVKKHDIADNLAGSPSPRQIEKYAKALKILKNVA